MLTGSHRTPRQDEVVYGRPAADTVARLADGYGAKRLLIVTTRSLAGERGLGTRLARTLGPRVAGLFADVSAHSPREDVLAGAREARRLRADLLVAVGGGSVIDATKVMQLCLWAGLDEVDALDAFRLGRPDAPALLPGVRMIAVPTTLSAAEFTPVAGVTDRARGAKDGYYHPLLVPRAVVLDPAMTRATPEALFLATGMKAVDHAVEQLCSLDRAPFGDALAADGLRSLTMALPQVARDPDDLEARLECQIGTWLAISGAGAGRGMGASHAIGHVLGGSYGVPHGLTSCVTLPAVLRWNVPANANRQKLISALMGAGELSAAEAVEELCQRLSLPTDLASVGIRAEQLSGIAERTMHDRGVRANPRPIRAATDVVEILRLARPATA